MILADKILALRRNNSWSQEELADKLNVSRQSVSKWESAASIPDINKIIELSKLFGVSTDYLLKDDVEKVAYSDVDETKYPGVTIQEANSFMTDYGIYAKRVALSVMLFILSPVLLILLAGIADSGLPGFPFSEELASGIGLVVLLGMVAAGVYLIIFSSHKVERYEYLKKGEFELQYGVEGIVKEKLGAFEERYSAIIATAVSLCILCAVPLIIAGISKAADYVCILLTGLMFAIIAFAVYLFITTSMEKESYEQLLRRGEYTVRQAEENKRREKFGSIYWPCVTAVYLAWSFITFRWDITWIIWPVAGAAFAGLSAAFPGKKEK